MGIRDGGAPTRGLSSHPSVDTEIIHIGQVMVTYKEAEAELSSSSSITQLWQWLCQRRQQLTSSMLTEVRKSSSRSYTFTIPEIIYLCDD